MHEDIRMRDLASTLARVRLCAQPPLEGVIQQHLFVLSPTDRRRIRLPSALDARAKHPGRGIIVYIES